MRRPKIEKPEKNGAEHNEVFNRADKEEVFKLSSISTVADWSGGDLWLIKGVVLNNTDQRKKGALHTGGSLSI